MKKRLIIGIILIAIIVCAYFISTTNNNSDEKEIIKIGAILPLSGDIAFLGNAAKNGLEFAKYYFESQSKNKYNIEFIFEDGQAKPSISINAFYKLVYIDKANIIFSIISAVDLSIIPALSKEEVLYFSHATHPNLSNVNSLFFRHSSTVEQEVRFIFEEIENRNNLAICYMNDEYGVSFENEFLNLSGMSKNNSFPFKKGETDFATIAYKILSVKPQKIVICGAGSNLSNLPKKLRELGFDGEIITTLAYSASGASKSSYGIVNLTMVNLKEIKPDDNFAKYVKEYEKLNNTKLGTFDYIFFNTAYILINSINTVGLDINKIAHQINNNKIQNVLGGRVNITLNNDILPELIFRKQ